MLHRLSFVFSALCALFLFSSTAATRNQEPKSPLRFRVTLSKEVAPKAASGRLLLLMTGAPREMQTIEIGLIPGSTWVAATAAALGVLMLRLKQPPMMGFMLAGLMLGPTGASLVTNDESVRLFAELGVLLLLFVVGLEISLRAVRKVMFKALACAALVAAAVVGLSILLGSALGWPVKQSLIVGFVLKLIGTRGAGQSQDVEQAHVRHILVRTSEVVSEADARRRLTDLRERIVTGGADFAELARLHSQDASASKGGDLGWVLPGDTVPEFERAFVALKPGEVSQPIRTPFGYHLIQLLERRSAGLTPERRRMQARLALKERKADEAYQEWLRQLRDRTYVEVRLEDK